MLLQPMSVQTAESVQATAYYEAEADECGKSIVCEQWVEQVLRALMQRQPVKDDGLPVEDDAGVQPLCLQAAKPNASLPEVIENIKDNIGPRLLVALMMPSLVIQTTPNAAQQRAHSLTIMKKRRNKDWDPDFRVRCSARGHSFVSNRQFKCDYPGCPATCTDLDNLRRHKQWKHEGILPQYTCPEGCLVKLWGKIMYSNHMRIHKKK